jgi:DNA repair protein SbcC/Rad50
VTAQRGLEEAQAFHAQQVAFKDQSSGIESRRQQLLSERQAVVDADEQSRARLRALDRRERERLEQLERRVSSRLDAARKRRVTLESAQRRCRSVLHRSPAVRRATRRLAVAERVLNGRIARTRLGREQTHALARCDADIRLAEQRLAILEQEAGRAALHARDIAGRLGLTAEVPCAGTGLQARCKLLGDAREARAMVPSAKAQIDRVALEIASVQEQLAKLRRDRAAVLDALRGLGHAERLEEAARLRLSGMQTLAAQGPACDQARTELASVEADLAALGPVEECGATVEKPEDREERSHIEASRRTIATQIDEQAAQLRSALARIDGTISTLPPKFDDRRLAAATDALTRTRGAVAAAEQAYVAALRDVQLLEVNEAQLSALAERRRRCDERRIRLEDQLGNWTLFARCMSNDGLIALAIDDAGPELSGLANDLLLASYGPRFTVSIQTLLQTAAGDQREGFDILVHDAESTESKSLTWMSGGERTIIEACLTRAIALYLARSTDRRYSTLFSDEADGALDPERKRRFMAMKREVLRVGGYEREYFVSQTPQLTAMADAVIDLDRYALDRERKPASGAVALHDATPA